MNQNKPLNKQLLASAYNMSLETLNKIHAKHFDEIGPYEFRRWLPKQVKAWKEILGEFEKDPFETRSSKSTTGAS